MGLYRVYIDEVGNHDLVHADDPNNRFLSLTGVILESDHNLHAIAPQLGELKREFFQTDPDIRVILHRKEILNRRRPFEALRDEKVATAFDARILELLQEWDYKVVTVVIDKKAHRDQYEVWHYDPYHYCMEVLLERYVMDLRRGGHRGDVMVESRGRKEDQRLMQSYRRLYHRGTHFLDRGVMQSFLTSRKLKVKPKSQNIAGLQIADLIAHPSRRQILMEHSLIEDERQIFGDRITEILEKSKYSRSPNTDQTSGYGKKLLP